MIRWSTYSGVNPTFLCMFKRLGGNINIFADVFLSSESDLNASSDTGIDGIVNIEDVELLAFWIIEHATLDDLQIALADYNNNGIVDVYDFGRFLQVCNHLQYFRM